MYFRITKEFFKCVKETQKGQLNSLQKEAPHPQKWPKLRTHFPSHPCLKDCLKVNQSVNTITNTYHFFLLHLSLFGDHDYFFFWVESHVKSLNWNVWTKCDRKSPCLSNPFSFCLGKNSPKGFGSSIVVIHIQFVALLCEQDLGPASGQILSQITDVTQCCGAVLLTTWSLIFFGGNSQWSHKSHFHWLWFLMKNP